jgi:RNA-directed DNA polymerase
MWHRTYRYARRRHPQKARHWIVKKYYTTHKGNKWWFRDPNKKLLIRFFGQTKIVRHTKLLTFASPDNPDLKEYWKQRREKTEPQTVKSRAKMLWKRQNGLCPVCQQELDNGEELHVHHLKRSEGENLNKLEYLDLRHQTCHYKEHYQRRTA